MLSRRFVVLCTRNNTLLGVNKRGERISANTLGEAKTFLTAKAAEEYLKGFHSADLEQDCKVVEEGNILLINLGRERSSWQKCDVKAMKRYCRENGIVNQELFRGRLSHIVALLSIGKTDEARMEMIYVRSSDEVRPYPKHTKL